MLGIRLVGRYAVTKRPVEAQRLGTIVRIGGVGPGELHGERCRALGGRRAGSGHGRLVDPADVFEAVDRWRVGLSAPRNADVDVVQRAVGPDLHVHDRSRAGRRVEHEIAAHGAAGIEGESANPSVRIVPEQEVPPILRRKRRGAVDGAERDRRLKLIRGVIGIVVLVEVHGERVPSAARHEALRAFLVRPPVVGPGHAPVDFLTGRGAIASDVTDPHGARQAVEHEAERVPQAERPDGRLRFRNAEKGIVGRNGPIRPNTENLSVLIREALRVGAPFLVAGCDVEIAIRAEPNGAPMVELCREFGILPDHHLRGGAGRVPDHREPADSIARLERGVVGVEEAVGLERRIDGQAHQATFAEIAIDIDLNQRRGKQSAVLDDEDTAAALGDEEPAVGRELERRRFVQAARDERSPKAGRAAARGRCAVGDIVNPESPPFGEAHGDRGGRLSPSGGDELHRASRHLLGEPLARVIGECQGPRRPAVDAHAVEHPGRRREPEDPRRAGRVGEVDVVGGVDVVRAGPLPLSGAEVDPLEDPIHRFRRRGVVEVHRGDLGAGYFGPREAQREACDEEASGDVQHQKGSSASTK